MVATLKQMQDALATTFVPTASSVFTRTHVLIACMCLKSEYHVKPQDGEVILALEEGRFASFLVGLEEEFAIDEENRNSSSDLDLINEAQFEGFWAEFPNADRSKILG